eukprot:CAMPEP_0182900790 /NCGR_PEP_ID=MMETSP0034_2-20130328/29128_1 /TAXON_ID=156128 /ORGANISM="Nephroselmis pyriformis, Strain CCMP717" /LENGTH=42 /DNA_ID= /DNA_START= /DNA_END= /DNA_ORIENTATION=
MDFRAPPAPGAAECARAVVAPPAAAAGTAHFLVTWWQLWMAE